MTLLALGLVTLVAGVLVVSLTRGLTFYYDEWAFVVGRQDNDFATLLRPHNEHIVLLPLLVFKGLFYATGLSHYWPYLGLLIGLHLLCGLLLFMVVRRHAGDVWALVAAIVLLFLGPAWEVILWPFEISFLLPVAAGLGALLLVERGDLRGDLGASGLLVLAFASGSIGVSVAAGVAVLLLFDERRWARLVRVLALPSALYALWLLRWGDEIQVRGKVSAVHPLDNVRDLPEFIADVAGSNLSAIVSLDDSLGWVLAALLGVSLLVAVARDPGGSAWALAGLVMLLVYWGLTRMFRPNSTPLRAATYMPGRCSCCCSSQGSWRRPSPGPRDARGDRRGGRACRAQRRRAQEGADEIRPYSEYLAPALGAMELARDRVDPASPPRRWSPRTWWPRAISRRSTVSAPPPHLSPPSPRARSRSGGWVTPCCSTRSASASSGWRCPAAPDPCRRPRARTLGPHTRTMPSRGYRCERIGQLRLGRPGVFLRASGPATVRLRRFAADYGPDDQTAGAPAFEHSTGAAFGLSLKRAFVLRLPAEAGVALPIPKDRLSLPWFVRVAGAESFTACGLPEGYAADRDRYLGALRSGQAWLDRSAASIVLPGLRIPVAPGAASGAVDEVLAYGRVLIAKGWAAADGRRRPADWLFLFAADGRLIASGPPSLERPDLASRYGEWTRRSGFQLNASSERAGELARSALTVVAVDGGRGSVLPGSGVEP